MNKKRQENILNGDKKLQIILYQSFNFIVNVLLYRTSRKFIKAAKKKPNDP